MNILYIAYTNVKVSFFFFHCFQHIEFKALNLVSFGFEALNNLCFKLNRDTRLSLAGEASLKIKNKTSSSP
jgi:hypothetical protein